jgi:hypothetical protein
MAISDAVDVVRCSSGAGRSALNPFTREHKKLLDPEWRKKVKDLTTDWTRSLVQVLNARSLMERATLELKSVIAKFDEAHGQASGWNLTLGALV